MSFLDSRTHAARQGIGQPVPRAEDRRLITGRGCYSDDVTLPRQAYAAFVRSPHAHARIRRIDAHAALSVPGVLAVLTGTDAAELAGIPHRPVPTNPHEVPLRSRDGSAFFVAPHPPLPADRVRHVGEPIAMVIAETPAIARDGVERVVVDYDPLPAVVGCAGRRGTRPRRSSGTRRPATCASIRSPATRRRPRPRSPGRRTSCASRRA